MSNDAEEDSQTGESSGESTPVLRGRAEPDELAAIASSLSDLTGYGSPSTVLASIQEWRRGRRAALVPRGRRP